MEGHLLSRPSAVILHALYDMYSTNTLTDITLLSHNNQEIKAHSCILSASSPVIRKLLSESTKASWERKLKFVNIHYDVLKHYVDSLYVEYQHSSSGMVGDFFKLCLFLKDEFLIDKLKTVGANGDLHDESIGIIMLANNNVCMLYNGALDNDDHDCHSHVLDQNNKTDLGGMKTINIKEKLDAEHILDQIKMSETDSDVKLEAYENENFVGEIPHVRNLEMSNKSFWMCDKCNRVLCMHRQHRMTESELDYVINTEGVIVEEPSEMTNLNMSNLSPSQQLVAEQYSDIVGLPYKLLVDRERGMKKVIYPCPCCGFFLLGFSSLLQHLSSHGKQLPMLKCCLCSKSFQTKSNLRKHDLIKHNGQHRLGEKNGTMICHQCGVKYCTEDALQKHLDNHANDLQEIKNLQEVKYSYTRSYNPKTRCFVRNYACTYCGRHFKQQQRLEQHLASRHMIKKSVRSTHQEQAPMYVCAQCGAGFARLSSLSAHRRSVHASSDTFCCEVCAKTYKALNTLRAHIMRAHGQDVLPEGEVSQFQCSECGRFVPSERVYKAHIRYHQNNGKPLQCRMCEHRFKHHSGRLRHEKTVHGIAANS